MRAIPAAVILSALALGCTNNPNATTPATHAPAGKQEWLEDFERAQAQAKRLNKPLLVNFTGSDWCTWCVKLDGEVFSTPEFERWAADNVVLLKVDFPQHTPQAAELKRANRALAKRYGVEGFPTILVLDPKGETTAKLGYVAGGPEAWIGKANAALAK